MPENPKIETSSNIIETQITAIRNDLARHPEIPFSQKLAALLPLPLQDLDKFLELHAPPGITCDSCLEFLRQPVNNETICACGLFGKPDPNARPAQQPECWRNPPIGPVTNGDPEEIVGTKIAVGTVVPSKYPDTVIYIAGNPNQQERFKGFIPAFIITNKHLPQ